MSSGRIAGDATAAEHLSRSIEPPADTAVLCFSAREAAAIDPRAAHVAMMAGIAATAQLLASERRASLRAIVLVADDDGTGTAAIVSAFVAAFGKTLARELARSGTTVNAVGGNIASDRALDNLVGFLLSDGARFVTGQSFGTAGARLADPRPAPRPVPTDGWLLVSGGAGAIGGAITRRLHVDGWKVMIGHRGRSDAEDLARGLSADGSSCRTLALDIEDEAAIAGARNAVGRDTSLAGVVLCSGWNVTHPFWTSDATEWDRTLRINFTGPAYLAEQLFGTGRSVEPGMVIAIGSEAGRAGDAGRAVYAGAKAAIARYTAALAGASQNVRAVTVAPGPVDTPLLRGTHGDDPAAIDKGLERLARLIPLGRMGKVDDIAAAVSFAASSNGAGLNGELISVGGGITMQ